MWRVYDEIGISVKMWRPLYGQDRRLSQKIATYSVKTPVSGKYSL